MDHDGALGTTSAEALIFRYDGDTSLILTCACGEVILMQRRTAEEKLVIQHGVSPEHRLDIPDVQTIEQTPSSMTKDIAAWMHRLHEYERMLDGTQAEDR